jgi:hypothetical protein
MISADTRPVTGPTPPCSPATGCRYVPALTGIEPTHDMHGGMYRRHRLRFDCRAFWSEVEVGRSELGSSGNSRSRRLGNRS